MALVAPHGNPERSLPNKDAENGIPHTLNFDKERDNRRQERAET